MGGATEGRGKPVTAVVLLSGGLDSATVLALARTAGRRCLALSFDYGQRHRGELRAAAALARRWGAAGHRVVRLDPAAFGGNALTDAAVAVPKTTRAPRRRADAPPPPTYVPARNTVFLAHALAYAEASGASEIHIGVNAVDYSGYPDCRPAFIRAFQRLADVATGVAASAGAGAKAGRGKGAIRVVAPLLRWSKARIIRAGAALGVDYGRTATCYDPAPGNRACGRCEACRLRAKGFADAGVPDPTVYAGTATPSSPQKRR